MSALTRTELDGVAEAMTGAGEPPAAPLTATLIAGGRSNLTFRLDDGTSRWVLRTPPRVGRTPSAHDVVREHRVTRSLHGTQVPVARAVVLHEDDDVLGGPFAISDFVEGTTVQSRSDLDQLDDATVEAITCRLVNTLATLHRLDHVAVGLELFGRPDAYAARQLKRWAGQWEIVAPDQSDVRRAGDRLARLLVDRLPRQQATGIVHGDFRIDNTLLRLNAEAPSVAAVVDWELSTIGDPVADVAVMCTYRHPALDLILGAPCAWTSDRLPDPDALAAAYERAGGVRLVDWNQHLALAHFKLAVIAAGIDHRLRAGATSDPGHASAGQAVEPLLMAAVDVLKGPKM